MNFVLIGWSLLTCCVTSISGSGAPHSAIVVPLVGIFGSVIRSVADIEGFVKSATDEIQHVRDEFAAMGGRETIGFVLRSEALELMINRMADSLVLLRMLGEAYRADWALADAATEAWHHLIEEQRRLLTRDFLLPRLNYVGSRLKDEVAKGFPSVSDRRGVRSLLSTIEQLREGFPVWRQNEAQSQFWAHRDRSLSSVSMWESSPAVQTLRAVWKNTADIAAKRLPAVHLSSAAQLTKPKFISLAETMQAIDVIASSFLDVSVSLDENAYRKDEYSFAFKFTKGSTLIGTLFLHTSTSDPVDISAPLSTRVFRHYIRAYAVSLFGVREATEEASGESNQTTALMELQLSAFSFHYLFERAMEAVHYFLSPLVKTLDPSSSTNASGDYEMDHQTDGKIDENSRDDFLPDAPNVPDLVDFRDYFVRLMARDWLDARDGKCASEKASEAPYFGWSSFFGSLIGATTSSVPEVPPESMDPAQVLGVDRSHPMLGQIGTLILLRINPGPQLLPDAHLNSVSRAVAALVHSEGRYREKVFGIYYSTVGSKRNASVPDCALNSQGIPISQGEEGLKRYFEAGRVSKDARTILGIVPGMDSRLDSEKVFADSIDYGPLLEEIMAGC